MFNINMAELKLLKAKTFCDIGNSATTVCLAMEPNCGCGAGGNCASSCVSGCAERG